MNSESTLKKAPIHVSDVCEEFANQTHASPQTSEKNLTVHHGMQKHRTPTTGAYLPLSNRLLATKNANSPDNVPQAVEVTSNTMRTSRPKWDPREF